MAKLCMYCCTKNEDNADVCKVCKMPFSKKQNDKNASLKNETTGKGYWQIVCPQCGEKYTVDSFESKIKMCKNCVDEFDAEQIAYEKPRFICNQPVETKNNSPVPKQVQKKAKKFELIDILSNKKVAEITTDGGVIGRWGNISKEHFKNYPQISHYHCRFCFSDEGWVIENLSNTNSTEINGVYLEHGLFLPVRDKDKILLADLLFEVKYVY